MDDATARALVERLDRIEKEMMRFAVGEVTALSPLTVKVSGASTAFTGVKAIASVTVGEIVAVLRWGNDLLVLPMQSGPTWQNWTPTLTGWSADPAGGLYRYAQIGKVVICKIRQPNSGTSNATTKTMLAPVLSANVSSMFWRGFGQGIDNGTTLTGPITAYIGANSTTIEFRSNFADATWTASGNCRISECELIYRAA